MNASPKPEHGNLRALDGRGIPYLLERSHQRSVRGAYLLLHGLGVDKNEYQDFYRTMSGLLSRVGFDVLRIDFPAHGESTADPRDFSVVNCFADAIVAAAFAIGGTGTRALNVFGTSFGAGPAVVAASFFRDVLKRVTLLAPAISYRELYTSPTHPQRTKYQSFYKRAVLRGENILVGERVALDWRNAVEFAVIDLEHHLSVIAQRTAIVHGDADSMVPHELSRELAQRVPGIDLTIVAGMDHGFMDHEDDSGVGALSRRNLHMIFEKATR